MVLFVGVMRSIGACDPYLVAFARGKWSSSDTSVQQNHRAQDLSKTTVITLTLYNYDPILIICELLVSQHHQSFCVTEQVPCQENLRDVNYKAELPFYA